MIIAPNSPRQGIIGGFVIEPPAIGVSVAFTPNSTWINIGLAAGGWMPSVGDEIEFLIDDAFSGMPLLSGAAFNFRRAWAINTNYAVGDTFVWFTATGQLATWLVLTAFTSALAFDPTSTNIRQLTFRGAYASGVTYTVGDLVLAPDIHSVTQTWVALSSFTSSGAFSAGSQWADCLAAQTTLYVVSASGGQIEIGTAPNASPLLMMTGAFFIAPGIGAQLTAFFGTAGFGAGSGLVPAISIGALIANGQPWIPSSPPSCPAAPASQLSWLAYHYPSGLYWTTNPAGSAAGDAVIGWVETNTTDILRASFQNVDIPAGQDGSGILPGIFALPSPPPPTPSSGIGVAGNGMVTFEAITFAPGADTSHVNAATIVLIYQEASGSAAAHLTATLASGVPAGTAATLSLDTDLTGIVFAGDWLLLGGEMLFVTADATSGGVAVERALGLTTAEAHAIGDSAYLLLLITYTFAFPLGFFDTSNAAGWGPSEPLANANIALFNIVVWSDTGAESAEAPINYTQAVGGMIPTGVPAASTGFLAHAVATVVADVAQANLGIARSLAVALTAAAQIEAINTTGLAPFLWIMTVQQDTVGGRAMIPTASMPFALCTEQSPKNTQVTALILYDGAGHNILISSTGDQPIP